MRVGFVTPRYGEAVMGGAEAAARQLAEHLVADRGWQAEVFTTCALDNITWEDVLEPGDSQLHGVTVHRYRSAAGRDPEFFALDGRLRIAPQRATRPETRRWVDLNGPLAPELVDAVASSNVDVVAFYPYLYYPTVHGIARAPMPTVLHPAAHDEPALYLSVFRETFAGADAIVYHTMAERHLVQRLHRVADRPQLLLGLGVAEPRPRARVGAEVLGADRPYVVSVGRVDAHKGSVMLARSFVEYKRHRPGPLALALVGPVSAELPDHPDIIRTGAVDEQDKWDVLRDAQVFISPSALESFSLVVLEAWTAGLPVVVHAACQPTREHCERSGGGLWVGTYRELEAVLDRLLDDAPLRAALARRGQAYVERHYQWPVLMHRYTEFLRAVVARGHAGPLTA